MKEQSGFKRQYDTTIERRRIIDRPELRHLVPVSDSHIDRLERAGKFPQRIKLGRNRVGWRLSDVLAWIEQRDTEYRGSCPPKAVDLS